MYVESHRDTEVYVETQRYKQKQWRRDKQSGRQRVLETIRHRYKERVIKTDRESQRNAQCGDRGTVKESGRKTYRRRII